MLGLALLYFLIYALVISFCASIIPIVQFVYYVCIKKRKSQNISYVFSEELFEAEYNDNYFVQYNANIEHLKKEEYALDLP